MRLHRILAGNILREESGVDGSAGGAGTEMLGAPQGVITDFNEMSNAFAGRPEKINAEPIGGSQEQVTKKVEVEAPVVTNSTPDSIDWAWDELSDRLTVGDTKFELPDSIKTGKDSEGKDLSRKEKFDILLDNIYKNTNQDIQDPFVKEYLANAKNEGFDRKSWLESQLQTTSIMNMTGKDFLSTDLRLQKNEDGTSKYSNEDINDYMAKLNPIELDREVEQRKQARTLAEATRNEKSIKEQAAQRQAYFDKVEASRKVALDDTLVKMSALTEIGGIPYTQSDKDGFSAVLDGMTQINKETGRTFLEEYFLKDDMNLAKTIYLIHKNDTGSLKDYVTNLKGTVKEQILSKLSLTPNLSDSAVQHNQPPKASDFV